MAAVRLLESNPRLAVRRLPAAPGIYRFRDARGRALYIGRATDLRHRVGSYWSDLGERDHLGAMVARIDRIEAVACDSAHEAAWLERNLLETAMPRWNRTPGGQEVPVFIRLDMRPRRPGLSVIHLSEPSAGVREFGPYLGGVRVREAVAALERILPIAYTGTGLTGSERDMGRQRGVSAADQGWIVSAIVAILTRHPDAVERASAALDDLRDRAAASLMFELAARIQSEADALDWVTSTQRVTLAGGEDLVAYGWAGGLLVQYEIRSGRLCAWSQRTCSEAQAAPRVRATPGPWIAFAKRNAELAAALALAPD